jgi:outer membrane protein
MSSAHPLHVRRHARRGTASDQRHRALRLTLCSSLFLGVALAAFGAAHAPPVSAQQVGGTLTLEDALRLARQHSPAWQRVQNDVDVAEGAVRSAWGAFLPSLSSSLSFTGDNSTVVTGVDDFGNAVELPEPRSARNSTANQRIGTQLTLFDGGANMRNLRAQRAALAGTTAQINLHAVQLDAQISREYYQAVRATRTIALEATLLESARERLVRTEELLRLAARNRVDVLGAQADVAQAEQNLSRARGEADKARLSLAATIGVHVTSAMTLDTVLPKVTDPQHLDVDALVDRALASSPTLRQRSAAADAARQRASATRGRRWPTIGLSAGYGRSMRLPNYGAFGELNPQNYGFDFGLTASLPIFDRFQTSAQVSEASAAAQDAVHDLRAARLAVERDVRAAVIDLVNAYRSLQLAEQGAALSRERQELTQEQYRLGGVTFTDLQNVIDRTAQAERQALDALFGYISARLTLEERLAARLED